jgi:PKD repeat protein
VLRDVQKKLVAFSITLSLIVLIFVIFTPPPSVAVYLHPGTPSYTFVATSSFITFNNVNLTIRESEAIPVNYLTFSIRKSSDNSEFEHVTFSIQGTEISDPDGKFTVTPITNTSNLPYQSSGHSGRDERTGVNYTFNFGYGPNTADLTILYRIRYITSSVGTFYAQLYVNSTTHTYASGSSSSFTVQTSGGGGGGGGTSDESPTAQTGGPYTGAVGTSIQFNGSTSTAVTGRTISSYTWSFGDGTTAVGLTPRHTYITAGTYTVQLTVTDSTGAMDTASTTATISAIAPPPPTIAASSQILQTVITDYGVSLIQPFYASDTNSDGIVDVFIDPNNLLIATGFVTINGHATFLISTNNDAIPEFFWDTATNTITPITHTPTPPATPVINTTKHTVLIEITVNKTGWIYLDITDQYPINQYPAFTLTIEAGNRTISSDRIWRKDGKLYLLDDPATIYDIIYRYTILPPTFSPINGATVTTPRPTITITYPHKVYMINAVLDATNISSQITTMDHKVFTYTPPTDLTEGTHTLSLTVQDDQGRYNQTSSSTFIVTLPTQPAMEIPWMIIILIAIVAITIVLLTYLRIEGYF